MTARMKHVMTTDIEAVAPEVDLTTVLERMNRLAISCLPVVQDRTPVGVISERDVVRALAEHLVKGESLPAAAEGLMSGPPITVSAEATADEAIDLIHTHGIRRLLVVSEDGDLLGLVTLSNIVEAQTMAVTEERSQLERRVEERTHDLRVFADRLEHMSLVDPMLGTGNRRAMEQELDRLQGSLRRYQRGFAVVIFDIDEFKKYNDHYGHPEGDAVLCEVAAACQEAIRTTDLLYRYGGEEFLVTMPETDLEGVREAAERIRQAIEGLGLAHELSEHGVVTVSLGVAVARPDDKTLDWPQLVTRADGALYRAKQSGRNRACSHEE